MFQTKTGRILTKEQIENIISEIIIKTIATNIPHQHFDEKEYLGENMWGKDCFDHSGYVKVISKDGCKELLKDLLETEEKPSLEDILRELYINQWEPSYVSGCGKNWISYEKIIDQAFDEWMLEIFWLYENEAGEEIDGDNLYYSLRDVFVDFLTTTSFDFKYIKELNKVFSKLYS